MKKNPMNIIEEELNAIAWHLKVTDEGRVSPCRAVIQGHLKTAKAAFDKLDNFYVIRECQP